MWQAGLQGLAEGSTGGMPSGKLMIFGGSGHDIYLGCVSCASYESDSVANTYGTHGSAYSAQSIMNKYGPYGSKYSATSACNPYATDPPVVVDGSGRYYGRLTVNAYRGDRVKVPSITAWLAAVCQ